MPNRAAVRLGLSTGLDSEGLAAGRQFAVRIQEEWINFWLPVTLSTSRVTPSTSGVTPSNSGVMGTRPDKEITEVEL
jgi:hypothetical protein